MRTILTLAALGALASCAHPVPIAQQGAKAPDGVIRHYVRSNRDGSQAERIVQFRPSPTEVAVYKWVTKCATAAYVTAQMDPVHWEAISLDAGKVAKNGGQDRFGRLVLDPNPDGGTRTLTAAVDLPQGRMADSAEIPGGIPWFLFDYDLGDLNAFLQETQPRSEFMFAFALVWPESEDFLTHMGTLRARPAGMAERGGRPVRRFHLDSLFGRRASGTLWIDPASGAIVEAELDIPNHPGMKDFRLILEREEPGGQPRWDALLKDHYGQCPA